MMATPFSRASSSLPFSSRVITKDSLVQAQAEDICKVVELLDMSEKHARTLLMHYRWDIERIFELLERKGREILFLEAGVQFRSCAGSTFLNKNKATCNICFEDVSPGAIVAMDCGHYYCHDCWTNHFIVKIKDGQSRRIRCMAPQCNVICDEAIVRNLVSGRHPDIADCFDRFLLESYIEDNNKVKWCPSVPHCGNAIQIEGDIQSEVECTCGVQFCFNCSSEAHSPCSCLMWEFWIKKCQEESETLNWLTSNTKLCPKCQKPVEKIGGCNDVTCICGQSFCWLCGGGTGWYHSRSGIYGHSCGRFKQDPVKRIECASQDYYCYRHYYYRYKAHADSVKKENVLRETIQQKIAITENQDATIKDYTWVMNGLNRLFRSRRVLTYSYPFAFCMFGNELFEDEMTPQEREMKKNLFEDQQTQLESNVESLSLLLEKDFQCLSAGEIIDTKSHVTSLSYVVDNLCKQMYECIEELLFPLQCATHNIAPYKSNGLERASEFSANWVHWDSTICTTGKTVPERHSGLKHHLSLSTDGTAGSTQKRAP